MSSSIVADLEATMNEDMPGYRADIGKNGGKYQGLLQIGNDIDACATRYAENTSLGCHTHCPGRFDIFVNFGTPGGRM
jgi:hypothetical protein